MFRSRTLNGLIVAALLLAWVVTIVAGLLLVNDATTTYRRDTGMGLAYAIIMAAMVLLAIGAGSRHGGSAANLSEIHRYRSLPQYSGCFRQPTALPYPCKTHAAPVR